MICLVIIAGTVFPTYATINQSEIPIIANTCQIGPEGSEYDIFVSAFDPVSNLPNGLGLSIPT